LPYTLDLVRLATSSHLAISEDRLKITPKDACGSIMEGYEKCLASGGRPFVLSEHHSWLRETVSGALRDPEKFWAKLDSLPTLKTPVPSSARKALEKLLPESGLDYRVVHRVAGLGVSAASATLLSPTIVAAKWRARLKPWLHPPSFGPAKQRNRPVFDIKRFWMLLCDRRIRLSA
jgi:hypothetical protein